MITVLILHNRRVFGFKCTVYDKAENLISLHPWIVPVNPLTLCNIVHYLISSIANTTRIV